MKNLFLTLIVVLAAPVAASEAPPPGSPADVRFQEIRDAYQQDRAIPQERPEGVSDAQWERLEELMFMTAVIQAGVPDARQYEHDRRHGAAMRDLPTDWGGPGEIRTLPAPGLLQRYIRWACLEKKRTDDCVGRLDGASQWCTWRVMHVGPPLDQLLAKPEGPVLLPLGHPYAYLGPLRCSAETDALGAKQKEIAALREKLFDKDSDTADIMRKLAAAYREAMDVARTTEKNDCAGYNNLFCSDIRREIAGMSIPAALFTKAASCMEAPEACESTGCILAGSACSLPMAAAAWALREDTESLINFKAEILAASTMIMGPVNIVLRYPVKVAAREALRVSHKSLARGRKAGPPPRRTPGRVHPDHALKADPLAKNRVAPSQPHGTQPTGQPTAHKKPDHSTKASDEMENHAHQVTARHGYATHQNPDVDLLEKTGYNKHHQLGKKPDSIIEGRYFDCYSPQGVDPAAIATQLQSTIAGKVPKQTHRILLNMTANDTTNAVTHEVMRQSVRDATGVGTDLVEILIVRCPKTTPCPGQELLERLAAPW